MKRRRRSGPLRLDAKDARELRRALRLARKIWETFERPLPDCMIGHGTGVANAMRYAAERLEGAHGPPACDLWQQAYDMFRSLGYLHAVVYHKCGYRTRRVGGSVGNGGIMPSNSPVGRCYDKLVAKGYPKSKAAKVCQTSTGLALRTGRPPRRKRK